MSASRSRRAGGRVTPKGVRPPGVAERSSSADRPDAHLGRAVRRGQQPAPSRAPAARVASARTGHRGGR
ncbi:MAG: hypothetical protein ABW219_03600 [Ilumatobacteraceae bacterium]